MAVSLFLSSGNLIADRRFDFGRDLRMRGDLSGAADLMTQAAELEPTFASAWFALGEIYQELNQHAAAIAAYKRACEADAEDRHGAKLRLMRLGAEDLSTMPPGYVRALFDQYAPKFDKTLVDDLDYRGPEILLKAVLTARHAMKLPVHFKRALDLGCGTGLAAREFSSVVDEFIGVDLSPGMIERARATELYAHIDLADMVDALRAEADASANLIIAADAVVYVPDLRPMLVEAARVLAPKGLLAFTVETHSGEGVVLGAGLRYAHSADYVRSVMRVANFVLSAITSVSTRMEAGDPVPGLVVTAFKA